MAPELLNTIDADELVALAGRIREYQKRKGWSDSEMARKFTGLGSTKTYVNILARKLEELSLENQLTRYRAVWTLIENIADRREREEQIYSDLSAVVLLDKAVLDAMAENGNARFVLAMGASGSGKSCALSALIESYGQRILRIEATEVWGDSPMALLGAVLEAFGEKNPPYNQVMRLAKVVEALTQSRVCLAIDEGHHLGPRCLNTLKTLLNKTPGEVVVLALDSLWRRMEREAYEEARQLTGNRLGERIQLTLLESDIQKMLERRLEWHNGGAAKAVPMLKDRAPRHGNLAFVREVCKAVTELADGKPVTPEVFSAAFAAKGATR